jgi:hypothetical protein
MAGGRLAPGSSFGPPRASRAAAVAALRPPEASQQLIDLIRRPGREVPAAAAGAGAPGRFGGGQACRSVHRAAPWCVVLPPGSGATRAPRR